MPAPAGVKILLDQDKTSEIYLHINNWDASSPSFFLLRIKKEESKKQGRVEKPEDCEEDRKRRA